ncbi:MAG TPA: 2-oxoacid:acceptor oxidoreductase subunit alpha, partial [Thermoplasmata archaeon]|nr:2-oxoacid:acceptor oxidoreductase subunit alpha [Thermoplasmata archaeon]
IGYGSTFGPIREAQAILERHGVPTRFYNARTLFPVPVRTLEPFLASVDVAYVVEHNYTGQFADLVRGAIPQHYRKLRSIRKYDGSSFRAPEIVGPIQGGT